MNPYLCIRFMDYSQTIVLYRPVLQAIAYNIVKCKADAEDIVQETFLKWLNLGPKKVENIKSYLIKAVTNNCLNHLKKLRNDKEALFSEINMKELLERFKETNIAALDLDLRMKTAIKIVHSQLEPLERAVYLLKEVFDFDYETLQETFNKKKEHCRQLFCRAKKKLEGANFKISVKMPDLAGFTDIFSKACQGDEDQFVDLLKKDISQE